MVHSQFLSMRLYLSFLLNFARWNVLKCTSKNGNFSFHICIATSNDCSKCFWKAINVWLVVNRFKHSIHLDCKQSASNNNSNEQIAWMLLASNESSVSLKCKTNVRPSETTTYTHSAGFFSVALISFVRNNNLYSKLCRSVISDKTPCVWQCLRDHKCTAHWRWLCVRDPCMCVRVVCV